jgi:hypothetical protein
LRETASLQTGVIFRDGYDVAQDARSGQVTAEILTGTKTNPNAVLPVVSFESKWKLETGPVFDVETRDFKTGDGAFLAVTNKSAERKRLEDVPSSFFLDCLFEPTVFVLWSAYRCQGQEQQQGGTSRNL